VQGIVGVTYSTVASPAVGNLTVRVKEGSSQYWLALLVDNTGNAARSVQVRSGGGNWKSMSRADYNYWIVEGGAGSGPFEVRVTDTAGHQATVSGISLSPGTVQATGVGMYSGSAPAATTSKRRTTSTTSRKATTTTRPVRVTTAVTTVAPTVGTPPASASTTTPTTAPAEPTTSAASGAAPVAQVATSRC
jgi:hypothetical protein